MNPKTQSKCKVCSHPGKKGIEDKLRSGMSYNALDKWTKENNKKNKDMYPSVSHYTLEKHHKGCMGSNPQRAPSKPLPDTIEERRKLLEDEAFLLLGERSPDKERTALLRCASDMLERRAKEDYDITEREDVQALIGGYETSIKTMLSKMCPNCVAKCKEIKRNE